MAIGLIPYGKLANGKHGLRIEDGTNRPLAAVVEIEETLPAVDSTDNFPGRLVFTTTDQLLYVFEDDPEDSWRLLDGLPVTVDAGEPPEDPVPGEGELYYDTLTEVLHLYDGTDWTQVGGRIAASIVENNYLGDGVTTMFGTGVTGPLALEFIEAFLDGIRQTPGVDYIALGNNVQFTSAPPLNVRVLVRTLESGNVVENAQTYVVQYTGDGIEDEFDVGAMTAGTANVMVFVDGLLMSGEGVDYDLISQNTTITSLTRVSTTATAVTEVAHGLGIGTSVRIAGADPDGWNNTYTVVSVPTSTSFTFTVSSSLTTPASADPAIYFSPAVANDTVVFNDPPANAAKIVIRTIKSVVGGPATGEANTASNVGSGVGVFASKIGVDLQFKTLIDGQNSTVVDGGNTVRIDVDSLNLFDTRVAINSSSYTLDENVSYVGVQNTGSSVTIDLSGIPQHANQAGRKVTIGDESGGAAVNNISITAGGSVEINGNTSPITISTNYGYVHLTYDGFNWFIRGQA